MQAISKKFVFFSYAIAVSVGIIYKLSDIIRWFMLFLVYIVFTVLVSDPVEHGAYI